MSKKSSVCKKESLNMNEELFGNKNLHQPVLRKSTEIAF